MNKFFRAKSITLSNGKVVEEKKSDALLISLLLLVFLIIALRVTGYDSSVLAKNSRNLTVILKDIFNPDWDYMPKVIGPTIDTIKMSLFGSFLGALLALPVAFLAASNMVNNRFINWLFKLIFTILRTLPTLVIALIATYVFGLGTLAGTFAIFIFSFAYVGKLMYEEIETQDLGAYEAMISLGYTKAMAFFKGIIPSIMPTYLSTTLFNFEGNVRYASILGYVGAGGLGLLINENIGWRDYNRVGTILFALVITVFIIELISRTIRKKLS